MAMIVLWPNVSWWADAMAGSSSRGCANANLDVARNDDHMSKAAALRELEKARVRECQMEKTVRWWTVCTAGWRKKWSKLRQDNEELRKQIKAYKVQINAVTQECQASNDKIEYFVAHNAHLKAEIKKLFLKYGEETDSRIQDILNAPDVVKSKPNYTCPECAANKIDTKSLNTPDAENPLFTENDERYFLSDDPSNEPKNVEVLTEMITKIFSELQTLKGEFVKHSEGGDFKDFPDIPMTPDQISQLKLFATNKQLEQEKVEKKELLKRLEQANKEITVLNNKIEEMASCDYQMDSESKLEIEKLSLSDDE